jgi:RHS repeat-associated protein
MTTFAYNDTASPPTRSASVSGSGINTHWTRTTMDGFGRTIKTETGSGALTNTPVSVVDAVYIPCGCSPLGKLGQVSQPHAPDGTVFWTVYSYDGLGRTTRVLSPDGISQTLYAYSGNVVTITDPAGKYKNMYMDKLGHLISVQEPDPTYGLVSTNYTYDVLDHLTQVQMQRGSTTQYRTFNYTSGGVTGGDLLSAANPENGTVFYTYNAIHKLATKVDVRGTHFAYTYDSFNRLHTVEAPAGNVLRTYTYDANAIDPTYTSNPGFSSNVNGRLATIEYPASSYDVVAGWPQGSTQFTEMFSYSPAGTVTGKRLRVTKVQPISGIATQTGTGDLNMTYAYNVEGKITNVTYPFDATTGTTPQYNYSYDTMMRPAGMTDLSSTLVSSVSYGPANEMLSMSYNGGTETRTYNSMLQLTQLVNTTPGQNLNITYTFPSGNGGKITSQTDNLSGETITYQYDSLNRLIQGSASTWSQTYSYDGFGNLTNRVGTGAALGTNPTPADPATNRLTGASYDANGNMLSFGNAYDVENRLSQANSGAAQYLYDGRNKRIWQGAFTNCSGDWCLSSDQVSMFGIDGKLIGTYTPSGTTSLTFGSTAQRVYFAGKLIRQGFTGSTNVVQDRLGSVGKYYPYGEDRTGAPNDQVKFATYTRDTATGNDYADQRYYAGAFGRFMTPDPYRATSTSPSRPTDPQSWNRYAYVVGDPANRIDEKGLDFTDVAIQVGLLLNTMPPIIASTTGYALGTDVLSDSDTSGMQVIGSLPPSDSGAGMPPLCPDIPRPSDISYDQVRANIAYAHNVYDGLMQTNPLGAFAGLLGFFTGQFLPGSDWDYKSRYAPGTPEQELAKDFGNFNFGAVLESFGFSYYATQNAAGVAQIYICARGQACGTGTPGFQFPYGDQIEDAALIKIGYSYQKLVDLFGCRQP